MKEDPPWHTMTKEDVLKELGLPSDIRKKGLTAAEAQARLEKYGENKLTETEKEGLLKKIWNQVNNILVLILVIVAVISVVTAFVIPSAVNPTYTNWIQVAIIVGVIVANTVIGIVQEGSAENAAEALKNMLSSDAVLVRDGVETKVPSQFIVPGDVVVLALGDKIPCDLRVIEVSNMASAEAALTGESVPIEKTPLPIELNEGQLPKQVPLGDRKNMCFSATLIATGSGVGVATSTGDNTEIGTINKLVNNVEKKKTAVLEQIDTISIYLAVFILIIALITFLYEFLVNKNNPLLSVNTALVCAVAMIPEGLEAIVTVTYAWAVSKMATQNAIVRALPAVETLGSVTVICSDKTGTLTTNVMSLTAFVTSNAHYKNNVVSSVMAVDTSDTNPVGQGGSPEQSFFRQGLIGGVLCSKCTLGKDGGREGEIGNPTELSILRASYWAGIDVNAVKDACPIIAEVPFSSEYKFMATVHESNLDNDGPGLEDKLIIHVKGAPDRMVKLCNTQAVAGELGKTEPINAEFWQEQIAILSSHGLRVLALLRGTLEKGSVTPGDSLKPEFVSGKEPWLTIVGLCAIIDPPRSECVVAIEEAHHASVRVAMITGDHKDTALAIGATLGLVDVEHPGSITGPELDAMDDEEFKKAVMTYNVFARASPENKIKIVKALQSQGEVASMTGDGVNDAPALKAANMGVAMGKEGTDVAREAADMILADDNFATILTAVKEGRVVWDNLRKVLMINTPINNAQGLSVLFGIFCGFSRGESAFDGVILTSIQVLYCNLICAVTLGFVAAVEPAEDGIMDVPPRRVGKRLIGRFLFLRIVLGTILLVLVTVASSIWAEYELENNYDYDYKTVTHMVHSQASNTLTFGACFVTFSARFNLLSSFHPRLFRGNVFTWYSFAIVTVLQLCITYIPGLNNIIFSMAPMVAFQWGLVALGGIIVFIGLELEKAFQYGVFDVNPPLANQDISLPKGASHLQLTKIKK
ncbi:P-type ATPase [Fragilariopsis cylindrus CCMP1102]|uniref:P-type ATPase n=1 Tax=Fragilariopsis cylindrus CCMP1102 TaxID=635003 RepID=A0A1E7FW88_9STRA|nr:P-type ATPase [Fragilariopsis cylindrus CCMP1102]|eukprot:OEU22395.1 P-type ATPase [Fragilariopsis cylindrus CCMP1102]